MWDSRVLIAFVFLWALPAWADDAVQMLSYSSGTGFFVQADGLLLTNYHVVRNCKEITVFGAVPESAAELVAIDDQNDLALLKTGAFPLGVVALNSLKQPLRPHDRVVVVGYPGQSWQTGQTQTREATIISTKGPRGEEGWLKFSDSLSSGNSGGPLLDNAGNVVGVVMAKGRLISPAKAGERAEHIEQFDLAISLPVIRDFLARNKVKMRDADSGIYLSKDKITDAAREFVVNVRCRWKDNEPL